MSDSDNRTMQQIYNAMQNQQIFDTSLMQSQGMAGGSYGNALGQSLGVLQRDDIMTERLTISSATFQTTPKPEEEGVVLWDGRPVPENWRGAKIAEVKRRMEYQGAHWRIDFKSVWTTDVLVLYLSTDKYSGEQADAIAATHMEALNQRRVG